MFYVDDYVFKNLGFFLFNLSFYLFEIWLKGFIIYVLNIYSCGICDNMGCIIGWLDIRFCVVEGFLCDFICVVR